MAAPRYRARFGAVLLALCLFSWCAQTQSAPPPRELTRIEALKKLAPADAAKSYPVKIRGVVTTLSGWKNSFFLQSGSTAISVDRTDSTPVHSGDSVEVTGVSAAGMFAPVVTASRVTVLGRANLPEPRRSEYASLATGVEDSTWVEVRGIVHSAAISEVWGRPVLFLGLRVGRDNLTVRVLDFANNNYDKLVDSAVTVDGVCGTIFNDKRQLTGVRLFVPSLANVRVNQASADPFATAETPVNSIYRFGFTNSLDHRIKISATVSYQDISTGRLYLQSGDESVVVRTTQTTPLQPGARVEAVGFLESAQISITLADGIFRKVGDGVPPAPRGVRAADMIKTEDNFKFAPYDGLLTRTSGQLLERVSRPDQETWVMRDGDQIFEAVFRSKIEAAKVDGVSVGSRIELTGVSRTELNQRFEPRSFILLVRSASDVTLLEARWWDAKRSLWLSGVLLFASLLMFAWVMQTRRVLSELGNRQKAGTRSVPPWERHGSRYAAVVVIFAAVAAIYGWAFNIPILRTILPNSPTYYPNSAFGFSLAAVALIYASTRSRHSRLLQTLLGSTSAVIALATLAEYTFGVNLHIDELLFRDSTASANLAHGRMAVATAITMLLVSIAVILANRKRTANASQLVAAIAGLIGVLNLLGHLYGERTLFALGSQVGMALHSLLACFLLSGGILALRTDRGIMSLITSDASGGVMARVLLPAAIVLLAILGWLRWYGQFQLGLYDTGAGLTLFTASIIIVFVIMTLASAALLNRSDTERARMQYEATHDALTSVMNRHGILEQMRVEMSRCFREKRTLGIALVDVDRFKLVNDELGHNAGDEVLKEVAQRLKKSLRAYDGVGRYGGEEFLLVLPGCDLDSAMMRAEALRSAIASAAFTLSEESRDVTISIGVSVYNPNEGVPREELIRWADVALYAAKANGRNQVQPYTIHREHEQRTPAPAPTLANV
jgi:diguanylate cyclase (GGDEF)-like protein